MVFGAQFGNQFSQTTPHFIQNVMTNNLQKFSFDNFVSHGDWSLVCRFKV